MRPQLRPQRLAEHQVERLARAVDGLERDRLVGGGRRQEDHRPASARDQARRQRASERDRRAVVDLGDGDLRRGVLIEERTIGAEARVRDQHADLDAGGIGGGDRARRAVALAEVLAHRVDGDAVGRLELARKLFEPIGATRHQDEVEAGARQPSRERFADPAGGAGDERGAAVAAAKLEGIDEGRR